MDDVEKFHRRFVVLTPAEDEHVTSGCSCYVGRAEQPLARPTYSAIGHRIEQRPVCLYSTFPFFAFAAARSAYTLCRVPCALRCWSTSSTPNSKHHHCRPQESSCHPWYMNNGTSSLLHACKPHPAKIPSLTSALHPLPNSPFRCCRVIVIVFACACARACMLIGHA